MQLTFSIWYCHQKIKPSGTKGAGHASDVNNTNVCTEFKARTIEKTSIQIKQSIALSKPTIYTGHCFDLKNTTILDAKCDYKRSQLLETGYLLLVSRKCLFNNWFLR